MKTISSSLLLFPLIFQSLTASSAPPEKRDSSYQSSLVSASTLSLQTMPSTSTRLQASSGIVSYAPACIPPDRDPAQSSLEDATATPQQQKWESCPNGTCIDPLDADSEARYNFERRVGGIFEDVLEEEIGQIIQNMSHKALRRLTDQLLSFTLRGERYLCLNIVGAPFPAFITINRY